MTVRIARIQRFPIKSIGGEDLASVELGAARRLPGDREWAVLHEGGERHAGDVPERWLPKSCFLRGAASAPLQAVKGGWIEDEGARLLSLTHPDRPTLRVDPAVDGAALVDWLRPLWPDSKPAPTRAVKCPTGWTDVNQPWLSILSVSSLAQLEADLGQEVGQDRWRANLWIDGLAPFAEHDLVGQILQVGQIELRITECIGRCEATSADTRLGRIDGDMPAALDRLYGHRNFGIYAEVVTGGTISISDEVTL